MKKGLFIILVTTLMFGLVFPSSSSASTESVNNTETKEELLKTLKDEGLIEKDIDAKDIISIEEIEEVEEPNEFLIQPFLSGNEATYKYWLNSGSQQYTSTTYGSWTNKGTVFHGPGTQKKTFSTKTSISIAVAAEIPIKTVTASFTPSFGKETTLTTEVSRIIPKGKKGQFQTRDVYKHYKVTMVEWVSIDGRKSKTGRTKIATIKKKTNIESRIILK